MPDPRYSPPSGPTVPGQGFGLPTLMSPEQQRHQVEILMNDMFRFALPEDDPLYLPADPVALEQHAEALNNWGEYAPDIVTSVASSLVGQYGLDPFGPGSGIDAALATTMNEILTTAENRSSTSTSTTTTREDTETQTGIDRDEQRRHEEIINRSETVFVDLPTAEKLLDDFSTGFSSFVQGLRREGTITEAAANWMRDNPDTFYGRWLDDLATRAESGEEIFKVVGLAGEQTREGQRSGGTINEITSSIDRNRIYQTVLSNERTQIEEETIRDLIESGTITSTSSTGATRTENLTSEEQQQLNSEVDRRINERTNTLINEAIDFWGAESEITTEMVFSRPELDRVYRVSPKDFLTSQFSAQNLENMAAGLRGQRQARRDTARGIAPSAPRRIGG